MGYVVNPKSFKWYYWLISHILESVKMSESNTKEKIMKQFEANVYKNML